MKMKRLAHVRQNNDVASLFSCLAKIQSVLLQVVFEILRDAFMQVHTGMSHHVVTLAGVDEEVWLGAGLHTGLDERQRVLRHASRVVVADDDLQLALQILRLAY